MDPGVFDFNTTPHGKAEYKSIGWKSVFFFFFFLFGFFFLHSPFLEYFEMAIRHMESAALVPNTTCHQRLERGSVFASPGGGRQIPVITSKLL